MRGAIFLPDQMQRHALAEQIAEERGGGRLSPTMRQAHVAGEKLFVDYAGTTIDIVDAATGEVHACQLFVAALGASSLTYAEAAFTQTLPDWIGSHTRAFGFYGGVPAIVVSDNLKSGTTKACFYEPGVNRAYAEIAVHYDTAFDSQTGEYVNLISKGIIDPTKVVRVAIQNAGIRR